MKRSAAPGSALVHPITLTALFTLALNDHVLKRVCPGVVTGKLSDFAGVVLLPVFIHALIELAAARIWKRPLSAAAGDRWLLGCVVVSLLAFGLPEVSPAAELVYRYGLGGAQWPFRALAALLAGEALPDVRPVRATADVTDLLAVPMGIVAYWLASARQKPLPGTPGHASVAKRVRIAACSRPIDAPSPPPHSSSQASA
jgi:hypothetical protein